MKLELDITQKQTCSYKQCLRLEKAWLEAQKKICRCGRIKDLTVDHIIPQSILMMMGYEVRGWFDPNNLQVLCKMCNQFKAARLEFSNPRTKEVLLQYLAEI